MSESKKYVRGSVRERLIRKLSVVTARGFVFERELLRLFTSSDHSKVVEQLSSLISEGYAHRLGTGRRGDPHRIVLSATWPFNKCPLCGHVEFPAPPEVKG